MSYVAVAAALATVAYVHLLPDLFGQRTFSNFYDLQARALLDGRMDVPPGSLGIEAFVVDGRHHLYFPPGPALLRMPVLALTDELDGRLTAASMLLAWGVTVALVALLIWRIRRMVRADAALRRTEAAGLALVLVASTAGSVILFLGSVAWVFHEAYAWAIPMVLGSVFCLLGVVQRPTTWGVVGTSAFTLGAVLSRTTAGWACAGAALLAAVLLPSRSPHHRPGLWWKLWLAGAVPVGIGMAVNWAKFRHPFLFPIDQQVFTSLNQHRRDAIAANGGDLFDPGLVWTTAVNYFRPDGIRFVSVFPYLTLPAHPARSYGGGFLDQTYRTGSIPAFSPLLFLLCVAGVVLVYHPGAPDRLRALRIPLLGAAAVPLGVMFYAYISHRYVSEFTPLLIVGGAVGVVELYRRLERAPHAAGRLATVVVACLALFGVSASMAAGINTQALASPVSGVLADYVATQQRFSRWTGHPLDRYVTASGVLPETGAADRIHIVGDCDAYFLGSGDPLRPWVEIDTRDLVVDVAMSSGRPAQWESELAVFRGHRTSALVLERRSDGRFRVELRGGGTDTGTGWFDPGSDFAVSVTAAGPFGHRIDVTGVERVPALLVDRETYDVDWRWMPMVLVPTAQDQWSAAASVSRRETPALELCEELLRRTGAGDRRAGSSS